MELERGRTRRHSGEKELRKKWEGEEEDVSSYWTTLRETELNGT
jgi:hypothetical protein